MGAGGREREEALSQGALASQRVDLRGVGGSSRSAPACACNAGQSEAGKSASFAL